MIGPGQSLRLLSLALALFWPSSAAAEGRPLFLELRSYPRGELLFRTEVERGFSFSTLITHSVHLSPVYETYRVEDENRIILESTRLKDMGWGVPSTYDNPSKIENGFLIISSLEKTMELLPFRVSHINAPRLLLGRLGDRVENFPESKTVKLDEYAADGRRIDIRVTRE